MTVIVKVTGDNIVGLGIWGEAWRRAGIIAGGVGDNIDTVQRVGQSLIDFLTTQWNDAWRRASHALDPLINALETVSGLIDDVKDAIPTIPSLPGGGLIDQIFGRSAPGGSGGSGGAPAAAGFAAPTSSSGGGGGSSVRLDVHVHGNVGDPATIGRRVTDALAAYVRTNGSRELHRALELR